jgi:cell division septation protein DedD
MPKNEDGEFELMLGNRQLLSVFFIVVILLGVFFAMGFIVGRNSPASTTESASARKSEGKPLVVDSNPPKSAEQQSPPPKETAPQQPLEPTSDADKAADAKADAAKLEAARAKEAEAQARADEEKAKKEERARAKKEAKEKAKKEAEHPKAALGSPSGTYLQLAATSQHEAEAMVDMLRKQEFQAITAEVPEKPGIFRVLVGPIADNAVASRRSELQRKGFPGDQAIKRSF